MAPKFDLVSEVTATNETYCVCMRIVKLWQVTNYTRDKLPTSMEMVLMDTKGDRIHASVKRTLIYKFQKDLKEGSVYTLTNLGVASNVGSYRTTRHPYKLTFQFGTKVKLVDNTAVPAKLYALTPPVEVFHPDFNSDFLVDVMGMLTIVMTERQYDRDGTMTKMIDIELNNDGFRFSCTLFGPYVDELNSFLASGDTNNAVVVVMFAKLKMFQGKPVLQNTKNTTKLIFNPEYPDAVELRKRMLAKSDSPYQVMSHKQDPSRVVFADDFSTMTPRSTIKALQKCEQESTFFVLGTVKEIVNEDEWWYTACVCHKKVVPDCNLYFCDKCYKHVLKVTPRYRIKLRVMDETASATFVIFDREAAAIFKKSCAELLESIDMSSSAASIPEVISQLVERTFIFRVDVEKETDPRFGKSICVKKISDDPTILQRYKELESPQGSVTASGGSGGAKGCLTTPTSNATIAQGAVAGNSSIEGCKTSSATPALNISYAQDLISRFSETVTDRGGAAKGKEIIASDDNNDECTTLKRSRPEADSGISISAPAKLLKSGIKIEKN